jgi:ATP-dependent helicase/nuclease subunit B
MSGFFTTVPGDDIAHLSAQFVQAQAGRALADAVLLLPTRRAALAMREAFRRTQGEGSMLLPRMISLADLGEELPGLLGAAALPVLSRIAPAMNAGRRLYLLAAQVQRFEQARGQRASLEQALRLAEQLAELQDRCTRAQAPLTPEALQALFPGDYAEHWTQSLDFLGIVAQIWPVLEAEFGETTAAAREVAILQALATHWADAPPAYPLIAIGSTGSQPATAALLATIAGLPTGAVLLPGLDPRLDDAAWAAIAPGHPYLHLKALLERAGVARHDVRLLGEGGAATPSLWLRALEAPERMPGWAESANAGEHRHLTLCPARHAEEEARAIALMLRHGLTQTEGRIALITPDEGLMQRVQAHLARFNLCANRLSDGTLAQSMAGSAYIALLEAMESPEALHPLLALLRHPLSTMDGAWLTGFELAVRGVATHSAGAMPALPPALRQAAPYRQLQTLTAELAELAHGRHRASQWVGRTTALLTTLMPQAGEGAAPVREALATLEEADLFGPIDSMAFAGLLRRALDAPWRSPQFTAHPQLFMLTPLEARLQWFDWVVLGNMQDALWPGLHGQSAWLNLAQQQQLGLPGNDEHATLMAHDVLLLGSGPRVFLSYRQRDGGAPAARSRYIERLVACLAMQGVEEATITHHDYRELASAQDTARGFAPEPPPQPQPAARPAQLPVSDLDRLFSDPYSLYAKHLLHLRPLQPLDAEPEARDFGIIAHRALRALTEHWNQHAASPDAATLASMADEALQALAARPNVQLFWKARLAAALAFVNEQEVARRNTMNAVQSEMPLSHPLGGLPLQLEGRIDRLEQGGVIVDYKTGAPPSSNDILNGKAVQLLAYGMLLEARGDAVAQLEYWGLPAGKRAGKVVPLAWEEAQAHALPEKLRGALVQLLDPATPLLARPQGGSERQIGDYDGISRYDEWAG